MAVKKKLRKGERPAAVLLTLALLLISAAITYFPGKLFPTWNKIFRQAGLNDTADVSGFPFSVHFIDVGQADCTLVRCGEKNMLIDTGDAGDFLKIDSYLKAQDVKQIDFLILTHAHADHIGSAKQLIESRPVRNIIMSKYSRERMPTTQLWQHLLEAIAASSVNVIEAVPKSEYVLGESSFTILAPNGDYDSLNNSSVVIKLRFGKRSFLFQGDAERQSEKDILAAGLDVRADVLKLGHHGSGTSSTEAYIRAVRPSFAVISCGENNKYKVPHESVLKRLKKYGIDYRRTDINGTIVIASEGENLRLSTEKG